ADCGDHAGTPFQQSTARDGRLLRAIRLWRLKDIMHDALRSKRAAARVHLPMTRVSSAGSSLSAERHHRLELGDQAIIDQQCVVEAPVVAARSCLYDKDVPLRQPGEPIFGISPLASTSVSNNTSRSAQIYLSEVPCSAGFAASTVSNMNARQAAHAFQRISLVICVDIVFSPS